MELKHTLYNQIFKFMSIDTEQIVNNMSKDDLISVMEDILKRNCETMFQLTFQWAQTHKKNSEKTNFALYMIQQQIANIRSILKLTPGIQISEKIKDSVVIEPTSVVSLVRTMYERTFIFKSIYANPSSNEEQDILFNLWIIKGLKNRQGLKYIPSIYLSQQEKERQQIEACFNKIISILERLSITSETKDKIIEISRDKSLTPIGYKFIKDSTGKIIDFKKISLSSSSFELFGQKFPPLYKYLSIHAHPSYLGVLQFSQMFDEEEDNKDFLKTLLVCAGFCQGQMASDFISAISGAKEIFDSFEQEEINYLTLPSLMLEQLKRQNSI